MFRIPCNSLVLVVMVSLLSSAGKAYCSQYYPVTNSHLVYCDSVMRYIKSRCLKLNATILSYEFYTSESAISGKFLRLNLHFLFSYQCNYEKIV